MNEAHQIPNHTLLRTPIGVRGIAAIVAGVTALWYVAIFLAFREGKVFAGGLSDFWSTAYVGCPLLALLLTPFFSRVYVRDGSRHSLIFWSALIFGLSPWLLFVLILASS